MRKLVLVLALLATLFAFGPARAQGIVALSSVSVDIWPEYDQPAVLVIYHITLPKDTALPANLVLRIPAIAEINAVAISDPLKGLLNAPYERVFEGGWDVLTITTNSLQVQVEYYDSLVKFGQARHIVYAWAGDMAVTALEVNFLRPSGAENLTMVPSAEMTGFGAEGLANYRVRASNLAVGRPFLVAIDYSRKTDDLGIANLPIQPVSTPGTDTPGSLSMSDILPWVLAAIGVLSVAIGIGSFVVWQRGGRRRKRGRQKRIGRARGGKRDEIVYCQECGKRAQPGDVFCRTCGARLKRKAEG